MSDLTSIDIMDINGCVVRDENGVVLANLREEDGLVVVERLSACSIGTYFYILTYLEELGFKVK